MKNLFFVFAFIISFSGIITAQTEVQLNTFDDSNIKRKLSKDDFFISELFSDIWQEVPGNVKLQNLNRGYNAYVMMDNPIAKSNFSVAIGAGISFHNLYSNSLLKREIDSLGFYTGNTEFYEISDNYDYSKNKLTLMYIDVPVEIRFRTKDVLNSFKFSVGFKAGYNVKNYTKYSGDKLDGTLNRDGSFPKVKTKEYNIENIEKIRYGLTARIGYGKYNISAYYALTPLMKKNKSAADEMFPISIGFAFTPF